KQGKSISIDRSTFSKLPVAVKRHLMRCVLEQLAETLIDIESIHIESMLEVMEKSVGKKLSLPYGLVLVNGYDSCSIGKEDLPNDAGEVFEGEYSLNVPGDTVIPGWKVTASIGNKVTESEDKGGFIESFDYDVVGSELTVRGKNHGDKFSPLGMDGTKSLKDYMIDIKVPKAQRSVIPIVCSPGHIIWIVGYRIDERAKVSATTKRVLSMEFERTYVDGV
ncbi:MAG: tRNA lysidine(34) synthetase TilS, partial [Dehalococcoidales bacterium]|nr:tRNA lysidine(34) synthetase TilS [Dehalococcoidales bacterium]